MKQVLGKLLVILPLIILFGCSSSEETAKQENSETQEKGEFKKVDADDGGVMPEGEIQDTQQTEKNAPVVKEPIPPPTEEPTQPMTKTGIIMWSVQLGAFKNESGAVQLVNEIKGKFNQPVYKDYDPVSGFYKVTLGSFQTREQASSFKAEVLSKGYPDAFTVEVRR